MHDVGVNTILLKEHCKLQDLDFQDDVFHHVLFTVTSCTVTSCTVTSVQNNSKTSRVVLYIMGLCDVD